MTRAAIVTGGGTGIGAAIARRLAADGFAVCVTGRRREPLEDVAAETGALAVVADTGEPTTLRERSRLRRARSAGSTSSSATPASAPGAPWWSRRPESWDAVLRTNLTGAFLACRAALPELVRDEGLDRDHLLRRRPARGAALRLPTARPRRV